MDKDEARHKKIAAASIGPMPTSLRDPMPIVTVTFEDGEVKELFSYYPDEISFAESEFIGLTEEQADALRTRKLNAYLNS